jgi:hypothetical protein
MEGEGLEFQVPVKKSGDYQVVAFVTRGPGYGRFRVLINGVMAGITWSVTQTGEDNREYEVSDLRMNVFDASRPGSPEETSAASSAGGMSESAGSPGTCVVTRIRLGNHHLEKGKMTIRFEAVSPEAGRNAIGVDQIILVHR